MRVFILLYTLMFLLGFQSAYAGFEGINGTTSLKIFNKLKCDTDSMSCAKVGDKFEVNVSDAVLTKIQPRVAASTTALAAANCGSTVVNAGAVVQPLPKGTTALIGCRYTFITGNASNFDVNPDNADTILALTNAAGDSIRNATVGNSVTLELVSATTWAAVAIYGTYTDNN